MGFIEKLVWFNVMPQNSNRKLVGCLNFNIIEI